MDTEEALTTSTTSKSKKRTPAYASFDVNTDRLLRLLEFAGRASSHFKEEMKNSISPTVESFLNDLTNSGSQPLEKSLGVEDPIGERVPERGVVSEKLTDIFITPVKNFTEGLLTLNQWIPVILVTIVEAYLKDVRIYEARINPKVMESSEQSVTYADVKRAESIDKLAVEMQASWARNFVDDGGPLRWIERLTKMGARGYDSQTAEKMETIWGVRHIVVHSAGIPTRDFVRRHPNFGAKLGATISISLSQVSEWIKVIYHFVDVTDSYFAQRYDTDLEST